VKRVRHVTGERPPKKSAAPPTAGLGKRKRNGRRCASCGRFARYDTYYARWWCDACERTVPVK
jgi:hypothetical protein